MSPDPPSEPRTRQDGLVSVTGFEDIDLGGDWTDGDPTPGTNTVVFLARKPA